LKVLTPDLQAVVDAAKRNPESAGLFQALLTLLENAPDSDLIDAALTQFNPWTYSDPELRERARQLLMRSGHEDLAGSWEEGVEEPVEMENVIPLRAVPPPEHRPKHDGIGFDQIGGLEAVKDQIRRRIIKPFQTPGLFKAFKRKSGGGVLMYGPPGCGKTMLARALTTECNASFIPVAAADILDMYVGVAEKRLAELFRTARARRPSVMFFDEMEALAQRRQFDAHQKVNTGVSVLLSEMDGVSGSNEGILFLGATNLPWSIDSAFRRPGRFDRTLFIPPPDRVARQFILKTHLRGRPHDPRLDLGRVVERTPGFSGADLAALVDTASDFAIDESSAGPIVPLNDHHFAEALREIRASTGEWLGQASSYSQYANQDGLYDDLRDFLAKYGR
jgi:SpoVK/Ycf46/Vps4 family AAA+-type ATPase